METKISSNQQAVDVIRAYRINFLKEKLKLRAEIQRHLSTGRKRDVAELSDERYAAAGYLGNPDENLANAVGRLREMEGTNGVASGVTVS
jgi:hypothetical protein